MTVMEQALDIKHRNGTLAAADFLYEKGIDYEFAMLALVGLRNSAKAYDVPLKNVSSEKRGKVKLRIVK